MYGIDKYTKLYLKGDGYYPTATGLLDSSLNTRAVTVGAGCSISTVQKKWGVASIAFNGGVGCYCADSDDWYFGTGAFTLDYWLYINAFPAAGDFDFLYSQYVSDTERIQICYYQSAGTYYVALQSYTSGGSASVTRAFTYSATTWQHWAVMCDGTNLAWFQNGTILGTTGARANPFPNLASSLYIGSYSTFSMGLNCYIDGFRVSNGIARWPMEGFSVPTAEYYAYRNYLTHTGRNRFMMNGPMRGYQSV